MPRVIYNVVLSIPCSGGHLQPTNFAKTFLPQTGPNLFHFLLRIGTVQIDYFGASLQDFGHLMKCAHLGFFDRELFQVWHLKDGAEKKITR